MPKALPDRYIGQSEVDLRSQRRRDYEVQFYAFDIPISDGEDVGRLPLSMRKASLAWLLARRIDGIFLSDFEQGEIGPDMFRLPDGAVGAGFETSPPASGVQ